MCRERRQCGTEAAYYFPFVFFDIFASLFVVVDFFLATMVDVEREKSNIKQNTIQSRLLKQLIHFGY